MFRNNGIPSLLPIKSEFHAMLQRHTLKINISFIYVLSETVYFGISAVDIYRDATEPGKLIHFELYVSVICFSEGEMACIRKYIDKCVAKYVLTFIQMKSDVLGGVCDEHMVFFISTTNKLNSKLFGNGALSQGSDGSDFSLGPKLSIGFLPENCSRWISLPSDFAVI